MAVPKQRVSSTRKAQRNTGKFIKVDAAIRCEKCGSLKLPHRICSFCYHYNGVEFVSLKPKPSLKLEKEN
jgi:large subunit ribosomal protein L32